MAMHGCQTTTQSHAIWSAHGLNYSSELRITRNAAVDVPEDGLEVVLGTAAQPTGQSFVPLLLAFVSPQNLVYVEVNLFVGDLRLNKDVELRIRPGLPSQEHVEVLLLHAIHRAGGAPESDIRQLMLAAGTGAAAKMNSDLVLIVAADLLELADQSDHPILGLADR